MRETEGTQAIWKSQPGRALLRDLQCQYNWGCGSFTPEARQGPYWVLTPFNKMLESEVVLALES